MHCRLAAGSLDHSLRLPCHVCRLPELSMSADRHSRHSRLAFLALIGGATGIGFAPILVRLSETGPTATAFYRLLFALPLLWLWVALDRPATTSFRQPAGWRDYLQLVLGGLFFTADLSIWHWSLQFTTVANSTLLTNITPIFVTIGARIVFGDRITMTFIIGMVLAIAGGAMLVGTSFDLGGRHFLGDMLSLVAAVFYAGYLLTVKHLRRSFSTPTIMAWSGLASCTGFGVIAWLSGDALWAATARGWMVLVALALVSHVGGQTLIAYGFGHLPASFSSVSLLWQPVVAAAVAWLVLDEQLRWLQGVGAVVVLAGIAVASGTLNGDSRSGIKK
jgi:drug/metabolite transporter (DMT)-like permease